MKGSIIPASEESAASSKAPRTSPPWATCGGRAGTAVVSSCCLTAVLLESSAAVPQHSVVLDRIVADVDGQAILASDVDDEMRFSALQPSLEPAADNTPQRALERVIDRTLIIHRVLQPGVAEISAEGP